MADPRILLRLKQTNRRLGALRASRLFCSMFTLNESVPVIS